MARATSSFPLPLSPWISTGKGARAARAIASRSATATLLSPSSSREAPCASAAAGSLTNALTLPATARAAARRSSSTAAALTVAPAVHRHPSAAITAPP
jgi:hypothetical protein